MHITPEPKLEGPDPIGCTDTSTITAGTDASSMMLTQPDSYKILLHYKIPYT